MKSCVTRQVRVADHLVLIIDAVGDVAARLSRLATEIAEVSCSSSFPEQGVNRHQAVEEIQVERSTSTRPADNVSIAVDLLGDAVWVSPNCRQFVDHTFFPDDRLKVENLGSWAACIRYRVLRKSGNFVLHC